MSGGNDKDQAQWSGVYMNQDYYSGQTTVPPPPPSAALADPNSQSSFPAQNFVYPPPDFSVPPPSIINSQPPPVSLPPPPPPQHYQHQQSYNINQQYSTPPPSYQYNYASNNQDTYNSYQNYSQPPPVNPHSHPPPVLPFPPPPPPPPSSTSSIPLTPAPAPYNLTDPSHQYNPSPNFENYNNNWNTNVPPATANPNQSAVNSTWSNDYSQYDNAYAQNQSGPYPRSTKDYYHSEGNPRYNANQPYKYHNNYNKYNKDKPINPNDRKYPSKKDTNPPKPNSSNVQNTNRSYAVNPKYPVKAIKPRSRSRSKSRSRERLSSHDDYYNSQKRGTTEREKLLDNYRKNYCKSSGEVRRKMDELDIDKILENEKKIWIRTAPADLYYYRDDNNPKIMRATEKLNQLCESFKSELIDRGRIARANQPPYDPSSRKTKTRLCKHKSEVVCSSSSDSDSLDDDDNDEDGNDRIMEELMAKKQHPQRLHPEMWFNDPGEMNDGPLCRCSAKSRRSGIRHGIYAGEEIINRCDLNSNNADKLYHYRITISPPTNFLIKTPTIIKHDEHEFIFEGFSMLSHFPLVKLPTCKVIRFNIEYTILYIEEKLPENFTIKELDLFQEYLFKEVLELMDFNLHSPQNKMGCGQFHFMPRFVRDLPDKGQEILSMNQVLMYLIDSNKLLIEQDELDELIIMPQYLWQNFADQVKGMIVTYPGKKPCSVRVDQLDRTPKDDQPPGVTSHPEIVHFGIRPPQLSYAGNTEYQKAWRDYVKFRHLLANMPKPSFDDKRKLESKENRLQELRTQSKMKRDVTVDISSEGFYRTGIMCDIVQHAMLIPVLVCHLRFHKSLDHLENTLGYKFKNRYLLQLALTHPSYRENFGTNPDHARNSLTNCGISQPEYGDRRIHYMNTRKRGINTLINIMSRFGARKETESSIAHNERLEFLGDAVVEFLTSIHLFHMFPDLEEGGLATYRAAIVQNQHLAVLAKKLNLEQYMLYAHGSDLCHDLELKHAMANCFEALMGSLFLDGGIDVADNIFGNTLFKSEYNIINVWINYPKHPLQEQEPNGDRQWIPSFELLQKLTKFEQSIGIQFNHIRLLARAFTDRSIGYTNLTLGSNQRLEFLGDTVLQLIVSEYLYKYFPEHHEGHLSLLRSSLVNNKTQAVVCDDLGMIKYALYGNPKSELKTKDRADLLEAFLGALYVDKGLEFCHVFCNVCFFPRLQNFIMNQDWNDPKSKLQQCCLTLRTMDGGEPDIPIYKVIECKGPTNTRVYTVAVYFQGKRLAKASGHSIQEAEMNSAKEALEKSQDLFPQLDHQKRVIAKSMKMQQCPNYNLSEKSDDSDTSLPKKRRGRNEMKSRPVSTGNQSPLDRNKNRDRYDSSSDRRKNRERNDSSDREKSNYRKKADRRNNSSDVTSDSDDSSSYSNQSKHYQYRKSSKYKHKYTSEDDKNSSDDDI